MPAVKYVDFEVSASFETIAKHSKGEKTTRHYVSITCPHCQKTFADVPIESIEKWIRPLQSFYRLHNIPEMRDVRLPYRDFTCRFCDQGVF